MKKILLLFSFTFAAILSALSNGEFFVKIEKQGFYSVVIADQTLISPSGYFRFFDLPAGNHNVTVTDILTNQKLHSSTIQIVSNKRKVYSLSTNNTLNFITDMPVSYTQWYMEKPQHSQTNTTTNTNNTTVNSTGSSGVSVSSNEFKTILSDIKKQSFDDRKLQMAKSITRDRIFTTDQVIEICKLFSFEKNKLDYAKYAYDYTSDRNNYYKVSGIFTFSSSKDELQKYIDSKR